MLATERTGQRTMNALCRQVFLDSGYLMPTAIDAEWVINFTTYHWTLCKATTNSFCCVLFMNAWQRLHLRHLLAGFCASVVELHDGSVGHAT
jgi:hypothetical protein